MPKVIRAFRRCFVIAALLLIILTARAQDGPPILRSAKSGPWSAPATWDGGKVPGTGARVQIRPGHTVVYDLKASPAIRAVHVAGILTFARDRDTTLEVGVINIQPGETYSEDGFDCDAHVPRLAAGEARPALEIGTPNEPLDAKYTAAIRLKYFDGLDVKSCPALVCCGGRLDLHGAPLSRTWVKLGSTANKGDVRGTLAEPVQGWKAGDRVLITATEGRRSGISGTRRLGRGKVNCLTEERFIKAIQGANVVLDRPLEHAHLGEGDFRGAVANLSRNVIVESAEPHGPRGHTMYHRNSAGAISYAEFRHLGKEGVLGRYAIHYHLCGSTMRGSYVIGASVWDSDNRWLTIHGTNYLIVRDCVGYRSVGHGFFLEDGTEVYNIIDRNLAVQAFAGKPLPRQALDFDQNEGAGFWWANSHNTFTGNVACENDRYGFRFEATPNGRFKPTLRVPHPDGRRLPVDIRTLPFVRFDDNEAHCDGLYGFNLGEGVERVGPDARHPFVIRNMKIWEVHYAFRPQSPSVVVEGMKIAKAEYGVYHPNYDNHFYRDLYISDTTDEPFNRGHDDDSIQYGLLVVDGLTFDRVRPGDVPLIQISDNNPTGRAVSHFRNVRVVGRLDANQPRALVDLGGGARPEPTTRLGVPIYLHNYYGPGRHAKIVSVKAGELRRDGHKYRAEPPLTGPDALVAEVRDVEFPKGPVPVDDLPPTTIITHIRDIGDGKLLVRGTAADNGKVLRVVVNGTEARALRSNFAEWEAVLTGVRPGALTLTASALDAAGNVEELPHERVVRVGP
ncbi:MAG TPA: G8 domain-containing protein [Gemmataceae bacterium]|nr:G8 domain-containing protein [Gemmataceae bacterium]